MKGFIFGPLWLVEERWAYFSTQSHLRFNLTGDKMGEKKSHIYIEGETSDKSSLVKKKHTLYRKNTL